VGARTQQIIDRLAERCLRLKDTRPVQCTLGRKPLPRRGGACSDCRISREFELDQAVAKLVNTGAFKGTNRGFATRGAVCMSGIIGFDGRITWRDNRA